MPHRNIMGEIRSRFIQRRKMSDEHISFALDYLPKLISVLKTQGEEYDFSLHELKNMEKELRKMRMLGVHSRSEKTVHEGNEW